MTEIGYTAPTQNVSTLFFLCPAVLPQNTDFQLYCHLTTASLKTNQLSFLFYILGSFCAQTPLNINQPKQAREKSVEEICL